MQSSVPPEEMVAALQFGTELHRLREMSGLSQRALGKAIGTSGQQVGAIERAYRNPSRRFVELADEKLNANGSLLALWPKGRKKKYRWLDDYVDVESKSQSIQIFQCQIVPGLLQTRDYARMLLGVAWPPHPEAEIDGLLQGRMERQEILDRNSPPMVCAVIDEAALRRTGGDQQVMDAQLTHLIKLAERSHVELQVLPFASGLHPSTEGSFVILEMSPSETVVYVEIPGHGQLLTDLETVTNCTRRFGSLRGKALPPEATIAFIDSLRGAQDERP